jgi:hypothetical protein
MSSNKVSSILKVKVNALSNRFDDRIVDTIFEFPKLIDATSPMDDWVYVLCRFTEYLSRDKVVSVILTDAMLKKIIVDNMLRLRKEEKIVRDDRTFMKLSESLLFLLEDVVIIE